MKYLLFFVIVQKWATADKVPTSKELNEKYLGVRIENDAAVISLGKKQGFVLLALHLMWILVLQFMLVCQ